MTKQQLIAYLQANRPVRCMARASERYPVNPDEGKGTILAYLSRLDAFRVELDGQPNPKWLYEFEALTLLFALNEKMIYVCECGTAKGSNWPQAGDCPYCGRVLRSTQAINSIDQIPQSANHKTHSYG